MDRQRSLMNQYKFTCICKACIGQWPSFLHLNDDSVPKTSLRFELNHTLINKLQRGDKKVAASALSNLFKNVKFLDKYAPCKTLAVHEETIKQCLALFGDVVYEK